MDDQELIFTLSVEETNLVLNSLLELPAKISMGLIQKVQQQASEQLNKNEEEEGA